MVLVTEITQLHKLRQMRRSLQQQQRQESFHQRLRLKLQSSVMKTCLLIQTTNQIYLSSVNNGTQVLRRGSEQSGPLLMSINYLSHGN